MRKFVIGIVELLARRRLLANPGIRISPSAKVNYRNIVIRADGALQVGEGSIVEGQLVLEKKGAKIIIGKHSSIGNSLISCAAGIEIGDDVLISWGCSIVDHNSHPIAWSLRKEDVRDWYRGTKDWTHVEVAATKIGNKSWLGFNVGILKGVDIGEGAIVGAGSIVTRDVLPWSIVAGNPAKMIREIPHSER
jgi:galactoside O-acetyltransferase